MGIEKVRYRRPVHPGDTVEIEAPSWRLPKPAWGVLRGVARVDGQIAARHDDLRARPHGPVGPLPVG